MRSDRLPRGRLSPDRVERLLALIDTPGNLDLVARMAALLDGLTAAVPGADGADITEAFKRAREIAGRLQ